MENITGARRNGILAGSYHFLRNTSTIRAQFENFRNTAVKEIQDLIPMIDVEEKVAKDSIQLFCKLVEGYYGVKPAIYGTNKSYNSICAPNFNDYVLMIGRYGPNVPVITGSGHYDIWHYSEKGEVSGISRPVDLDRFHPDFDFETLKMPATSTPINNEYVEVIQNGELTCYYPNFSRIDLVTGTMTAKTDDDVIFVCAGAFTGSLLEQFAHSNIAGHHVSGGIFYEGYQCGPNNGVFTWSRQNGWKFYNYAHQNSVKPLKTVAAEGGMGYCQSLLLFEGNEFAGCFNADKMNQYRALCELDGRLCIIDCTRSMRFQSFKDNLKALGVKYAIYCDMGTGWNYSWYRQQDGSIKELFPTRGRYTTNWITFYK